MYVGRIVCVGLNPDGKLCASYRVSSRSFPNRRAVPGARHVAIIPKAGYESDIEKNPYIAYNCVRIVAGDSVAVVTNGSHTEPIAEKIDGGVPVRDALIQGLHALDYEKDQYNTPRLAAVADGRDEPEGWLGVVRDDGLEVRRMPLRPSWCFFVATYERNSIGVDLTDSLHATTPEEACETLLSKGVFASLTNAVTGVAAMAKEDGGYALATKDVTE